MSENKSLHRFFYPNKQSKTRKERSDFAVEGTCLNEQYAFTTSCLYPHNAYLSSTPSAQHNSRIKRTFRPQAFHNPCKTPNADDTLPLILSCPQDMPQCANAYHGEIIFVHILQQAFPALNLCYITHKNFSIVQKSGQLNAVRLVILFYRNDVVVNRLTAVYKVYIKI